MLSIPRLWRGPSATAKPPVLPVVTDIYICIQVAYDVRDHRLVQSKSAQCHGKISETRAVKAKFHYAS